MDNNILNHLNESQRLAVSNHTDNLLVLAGAGSGKTRVLVYRIAWLVQQCGVSPNEILAVTFTNKAASEMRHRIERLLSGQMRGYMWLGTFHSICHRMMRHHHELFGLPAAFQIMDQDDQQRLLKKIHKDLNLTESRWPVKKSQQFINQAKEKMLRSDQVATESNPFIETLATVYQQYEAICRRSALVDFNELMLAVYEKLHENEAFLNLYRQRFKHILVDEFQDTNQLQYAWVQLLSTESNRVMVVGDDDQSIYSWRGADLTHVFSFERDFLPVKVIRLEQNYRSTQTILSAANAVIGHNVNRMGKELWTAGGEGEKIQLYHAHHEYDEADFLVGEIQRWFSGGGNYDEVAVLYRSNAQSRVIEEVFARQQIPFRVFGGLRFFDRAEIKDVLAYLRLIINRCDDAAFERIINHPPRGIGQVSLTLLRNHAKRMEMSMWDAMTHLLNDNQVSGRSQHALCRFIELIESLAGQLAGMTSISEFAQQVIEQVALVSHYRSEPGDRGEFRVENVEELVSAMARYKTEQSGCDALGLFLSDVVLDVGQDASASDNGVRLMTLHSAKGLEFKLVLLIGMEEGLFPHKMSSFDPDQVEEERRLCYVGMTRAMQRLVLTVSEVRRLYGQETYQRPSRFITEIPANYVDTVRLRQTPSRLNMDLDQGPESQLPPYTLGQRVKHHKFGEGVVINYDSSQSGRVQVRFYELGVKWLACEYTTLELIS
ncbi:MAG: DNA helicase II [Legionellales bacterium]|nr:DNA helicase II [Legionellales bacterium]